MTRCWELLNRILGRTRYMTWDDYKTANCLDERPVKPMKIQKEDSILNNSYRQVEWWEASTVRTPPGFRLLAGQEAHVAFEGRCYSKPVSEKDETLIDHPKSRLQLVELRNRAGNQEWYSYVGLLVKQDHGRDDHTLIQTEPELVTNLKSKHEMRQEAAEKLYGEIFQLMTVNKIHEATTPELHKDIVLLGDWKDLTKVEKMPDKLKRGWRLIDERVRNVVNPVFGEPDIKVLEGFFVGCNGKEKLKWGISSLEQPGRFLVRHNLFEWTVKLAGKGIRINQSLDWFVAEPEKYLRGEVSCKRCARIGKPDTMYAVIARMYGLLCGICIDWLADYCSEQLTPDMYDRYLYPQPEAIIFEEDRDIFSDVDE